MKISLITVNTIIIFAISCCYLMSCETKVKERSEQEMSVVDYVNPFIGSLQQFGRGRTFPGVGLPFAHTPWTPDNTDIELPYTWGKGEDSLNIKHEIPPEEAEFMKGFRATHWPNGSFSPEYGSLVIMPVVGDLKVRPQERADRFSHDSEIGTPYYYAVTLDGYDVRAELTSKKYSGILRFTFPKSKQAHIVVDARPQGGFVKILPDQQSIIGYTDEQGASSLTKTRGYFVVEFNKPFKSWGTWNIDQISPSSKEEKSESGRPGAYVSFAVKENEEILVKSAVSFISIEKAQHLLSHEIPDWEFEEVKQEVRMAWNNALETIKVEGGTEEQKKMFYTGLYNAMRHPRNATEEGEYWSAYDGEVHQAEDWEYYSFDEGFWDTFRAKHPLLTIIAPQVSNDGVRSLLAAYQQGGWLPRWPQPGYRKNGMIGDHAAAIIATNFSRGIRDYDAKLALEAMKKSANEPPPEYHEGRRGGLYYNKMGYVPADKMGMYRGRLGGQATAITLEYAYDDYCIAKVAKELGQLDYYETFIKRSQNYRNVFDPDVGFFRGRNEDGTWTHEPFDPLERHGPFTEATAWHYLWSVQHDVKGLIDLLGGPKAFEQKLQQALVEGMKTKYMAIPPRPQYQNLYFWFGNEPVQHAAYLFNQAGVPWQTQFWVRDIMFRAYSDAPNGYPGDDDTGQISSWYVFGALGFYPVSPASAVYEIGSPVFKRAEIKLDDKWYSGNTFTIIADNADDNNIYIQSAELNGESLDRSYITHEEITRGGTLRFVMGPKPNKEWADNPDGVREIMVHDD